MEIIEYLSAEQEPLPKWLEKYEPNDKVLMSDFLSSRIVFYPGSGSDGHPVKVFGSTHACHCFVYADYWVEKSQIKTELKVHGFKGYSSFASINLKQQEILSHWQHHLEKQEFEEAKQKSGHRTDATSYGMLEILQRDENLDESHGPERLAILFLGADGIATYDALFCQQNSNPLFGMLLQDHGYGGNYDRFGRGGLMEKIASRTKSYPRYMLVADNTEVWDGYEVLFDLGHSKGGMHQQERYLHKRIL